jgi:hypothetical protein
MFDYRDMLKKYIDMVGREENTYLTDVMDGYFSWEEREELLGIIDEIS